MPQRVEKSKGGRVKESKGLCRRGAFAMLGTVRFFDLRALSTLIQHPCFSSRLEIIARLAFVLNVFVLNFSGTQANSNEQTIRRLRSEFNHSISAHDGSSLARFWRADLHVTTGAGRQLNGRDEVRAVFEAAFADATFITYTRTPDRIELSASGIRAAESGRWLGQWKKPDGSMEWRGTYLAMWRKESGQWLIQSELYVSLKCTGSKECSD